MSNLPTRNICYRKDIFSGVRFEGGPQGQYFQAEDLVLNWTLARRGEKLLFDPAIQVVHLNRTRLGVSLSHQHLLGRGSCWARKRTDLPGRVFVAFPFLGAGLPFLRTMRIAIRLSRMDRAETLRLLGLSPLILLDAIAWAAGFVREALRR